MAEWQHKERFFNHPCKYDDIEGNRPGIHERNMESQSFPNWLDWQCEGGWEVFKISRDFNGTSGTWCIFRRLV